MVTDRRGHGPRRHHHGCHRLRPRDGDRGVRHHRHRKRPLDVRRRGPDPGLRSRGVFPRLRRGRADSVWRGATAAPTTTLGSPHELLEPAAATSAARRLRGRGWRLRRGLRAPPAQREGRDGAGGRHHLGDLEPAASPRPRHRRDHPRVVRQEGDPGQRGLAVRRRDGQGGTILGIIATARSAIFVLDHPVATGSSAFNFNTLHSRRLAPECSSGREPGTERRLRTIAKANATNKKTAAPRPKCLASMSGELPAPATQKPTGPTPRDQWQRGDEQQVARGGSDDVSVGEVVDRAQATASGAVGAGQHQPGAVAPAAALVRVAQVQQHAEAEEAAASSTGARTRFQRERPSTGADNVAVMRASGGGLRGRRRPAAW